MSRKILAGGLRGFIAATLTVEACGDSSETSLSLPWTENPLWGAPRIHGEVLKLGIEVGETSVSK